MIIGTSNLSVVRAGDSNITISWDSGVPPFQLHRTFDWMGWEPVGNPTLARSRTISTLEHPHAFFRIEEGIKLLDIDLDYADGTKLVWQVPELE